MDSVESKEETFYPFPEMEISRDGVSEHYVEPLLCTFSDSGILHGFFMIDDNSHPSTVEHPTPDQFTSRDSSLPDPGLRLRG